jgi:hypothetical protein
MENNMKLVNDANNPELVGIITELDDVSETMKIVNSLNKDLMDSGFDQYQYQTVQRGDKIYIEKK